jgi:hypothetical protein
MDVQKTMEFILQQQAKAESQMASIRKLIQTGMRMIVKNEGLIKKNEELIKKNEESIKELARAQKELAVAQKVTETKLQGLIDAWRRGGNGRHSKN